MAGTGGIARNNVGRSALKNDHPTVGGDRRAGVTMLDCGRGGCLRRRLLVFGECPRRGDGHQADAEQDDEATTAVARQPPTRQANNTTVTSAGRIPRLASLFTASASCRCGATCAYRLVAASSVRRTNHQMKQTTTRPINHNGRMKWKVSKPLMPDEA